MLRFAELSRCALQKQIIGHRCVSASMTRQQATADLHDGLRMQVMDLFSRRVGFRRSKMEWMAEYLPRRTAGPGVILSYLSDGVLGAFLVYVALSVQSSTLYNLPHAVLICDVKGTYTHNLSMKSMAPRLVFILTVKQLLLIRFMLIACPISWLTLLGLFRPCRWEARLLDPALATCHAQKMLSRRIR